jgi:hypothetical protein
LKDYWEDKDELCEDNKNGAGNKKNSERRPHVIEDAPSRIAPTSSKNYKVEEKFKFKFQEIKFQLQKL